jgi:hypothetical protein
MTVDCRVPHSCALFAHEWETTNPTGIYLCEDFHPEVRYTSFTVFARLIAYFFVGVLYAVGPLLLLIAIASSIPTARFVLASNATDGKIVYLQRVYSRRFSKETYKPVVHFTDNNAQPHIFVADSRIGLVPLKPGDTIRVIYIASHPETARIDTFPQLWMAQFILGLVGIFFTTVALRIMMRKRALSHAASSI